jgi:hypothetical protein
LYRYTKAESEIAAAEEQMAALTQKEYATREELDKATVEAEARRAAAGREAAGLYTLNPGDP